MQASERLPKQNISQATTTVSTQRPVHLHFQSNADTQDSNPTLLDAVRMSITVIGTGLGIATILMFQQLLIQLYFACWQMALLFAFIGLMVAFLFGQCHLKHNHTQSCNWFVMSSMAVTLLGLGVVMCIATATPGLS